MNFDGLNGVPNAHAKHIAAFQTTRLTKACGECHVEIDSADRLRDEERKFALLCGSTYPRESAISRESTIPHNGSALLVAPAGCARDREEGVEAIVVISYSD